MAGVRVVRMAVIVDMIGVPSVMIVVIIGVTMMVVVGMTMVVVVVAGCAPHKAGEPPAK